MLRPDGSAITADRDEYYCNPEIQHVALNFQAAAILQNNLGGFGPGSGAEIMYFENMGTYNGQQIDMSVRATSTYDPKSTGANKLNGKFGQINLRTGGCATFEFSMMYRTDPESQVFSQALPLRLPEFYMAFFDLDQYEDVSQESVTITTSASFDVAFLLQGRQVDLDYSAGRFTVTSKETGDASDNPTDPKVLNAKQEARSVAFLFRNQQAVEVEFCVTEGLQDGGRNFLFAMSSDITPDCSGRPECYDPPPQPPSMPPPPLPPPPLPPPPLPPPLPAARAERMVRMLDMATCSALVSSSAQSTAARRRASPCACAMVSSV